MFNIGKVLGFFVKKLNTFLLQIIFYIIENKFQRYGQ